MSNREEKYREELKHRIGAVFDKHQNIFDHRKQYPWVTGFLGNPFSGIWFVAENPSLGQVEKAVKEENIHLQNIEGQWNISRGDRLFRDTLVKFGFKNPPPDSIGGWNCYITDIIKETDYAEKWNKLPVKCHKEKAEIWYEVLKWEYEVSKPKLVVVMGKKVEKLLDYLKKNKGFEIPKICFIEHYAYVAHRPKYYEGAYLKSMHSERVKEYENQMKKIAEIFSSLP